MMMTTSGKSSTAFRTISVVALEVGVPQHVLRFWETRFAEISPLKRGGNRRYYRPADVALLHNINRLLYSEGYTIKGVQRLLSRGEAVAVASPVEAPVLPPSRPAIVAAPMTRNTLPSLPAIRAQLAAALAAARLL